MFVLGIDIGKEEIVVSLQEGGTGRDAVKVGACQAVPNNAAGFTRLERWLLRQNVLLSAIHVVMEATNVYWETCAHHFHGRGCTVSVVNPAQIKFFARSTLRRGKTDAMDADLIACFGLTMRPAAWTPPQQALVEIKQLVREREAVLAELVRVRNHLQALQKGQYSSPLVVRLAKQRIRLLERQVKALEKMLHDAFAQDTRITSPTRSTDVGARLWLCGRSHRPG